MLWSASDGALMRLSDAICEELAHTHHEKLIALKERSWLNPRTMAQPRLGAEPAASRASRWCAFVKAFIATETKDTGARHPGTLD